MSVQVKSKLSLPVMFQKIDDINDESKRFIKVKIWLLHLGQNFNGSVFEKEVVDKAIPTLQYVPIVGFIKEGTAPAKDAESKDKKATEDFSDHHYIIVKTENGKELKYVGSAYGVILSSEDNNAHYEERLCDDGETRTFLVVDGIMWDMFEDSAEIMKRDIVKSHSMELWDDEDSYDGYEDENGLFHFTKFSFRAACILGDKYSPAMINSTVEVQFTVSDFIKRIQEELNNKYMEFTKINSNSTQNQNTNSTQGGNEIMSNSNTDFQTTIEQLEDIGNIVSQKEMITDRWGDIIPRYRLVDVQNNEVIIRDIKNYGFYGCSYTVDGDKPVIDFESAKRKKIVYEDYLDGTQLSENTFDISTDITQIEDKAFQKVEEVNQKISDIQADYATVKSEYAETKALYDEMKPKYDAYVQDEQARTKAAEVAEKNQIFTKFESALKDNADFISLKDDFEKGLLEDMAVADIEMKCYAIFGKQNMGTNFSKSEPVKLEIMDDEITDNVVITKYGNIPVSK